jgi:dTDP-4-dehydrorhamnose reductase
VEAAERETCAGKQRILVMKIAIIGANGQLGCDHVKVFNGLKCEIVPLTQADIDVAKFELSEKVLKNIRPDVIINCAA